MMQEKYKDNIIFAEVSGRKSVLCFRNMADWKISDQWYDNKRQNDDDEAKRIIETDTKIVKSKLKELLQSNATGSTTCYPSIDNIKIGWIPNHLCLCFSSFICSELKIWITGKWLIKAAIPRHITQTYYPDIPSPIICLHRDVSTVQSNIFSIMWSWQEIDNINWQ